jgi:hypothetical protein
MNILRSIRRFFHRPPDFVIGSSDAPYMRRWWVIPRNRVFNIYLHNIRRDDDDRALHDHPWWNVSVVLGGGYWEIRPVYQPVNAPTDSLGLQMFQPPHLTRTWRGWGSIVVRKATAAHRLVLDDSRPSWSLFLTGRTVRSWGFWCPNGWVPWREFVDITEGGNTTGKGCG